MIDGRMIAFAGVGGAGIGGEADLDALLMLRVRDGDEECFRLLLNKHRIPVVNFLYRMVQDRAVAEELGQEVFLRMYRSRGSYEVSAKFTTWMFRIATHVALNNIRDNKAERAGRRVGEDSEGRARELPDRVPSTEQRLVDRARLQEVRDAIGRLPEKQRAAVLMHKYEEMEYSRIAAVLECSESAVKSMLFRAYETLRARLSHMAVAGGAR